MKHTFDTAMALTNRGFAYWASCRTSRLAGCNFCEPVLDAVHRYLNRKAEFIEVRLAREAARKSACAFGLARNTGMTQAGAAMMAAWHTGHESAEAAARCVIFHAVMAAGFRADREYREAAREIERSYLQVELRRWQRELAQSWGEEA